MQVVVPQDGDHRGDQRQPDTCAETQRHEQRRFVQLSDLYPAVPHAQRRLDEDRRASKAASNSSHDHVGTAVRTGVRTARTSASNPSTDTTAIRHGKGQDAPDRGPAPAQPASGRPLWIGRRHRLTHLEQHATRTAGPCGPGVAGLRPGQLLRLPPGLCGAAPPRARAPKILPQALRGKLLGLVPWPGEPLRPLRAALRQWVDPPPSGPGDTGPPAPAGRGGTGRLR